MNRKNKKEQDENNEEMADCSEELGAKPKSEKNKTKKKPLTPNASTDPNKNPLFNVERRKQQHEE